MFTYKHKKTGAVISTHGKVTGANWELVKHEKKDGQKPAGKPKKDENKQTEDGQE